jgi:hypothetical protein
MVDFENQGNQEDIISIGADTSDLVAASQQIEQLAQAFDRLAAAASAVSAAEIDQETGVIDPAKVEEASAALLALKKFSSEARKEIFSIGQINLSELNQELEDISRKMDAVSRAADRLRTVASKRTADKAKSEKNVRSAIQSGTYTSMSPESARELFDVDDKPLMEAQEEIRRLRAELAIAASRRSGPSANSPRRAQQTIDRTVRERREAAERREEEALRSRVADAESDVRRDPEIASRATKPLSGDEKVAADRVREREERAKKLSDALRKANEASRRAQEEAAALRRQEMQAESNAKATGPVDETQGFTPYTGTQGSQLGGVKGGLPESKVIARRLPGPGPEELPKIRAEIAAKKAEVAKVRKEQVELSRALGELLSSDPMEGLTLPSSSVIDTGKLKTEVRKKLLAAFSAKIKEETKSEPTEEMISDFKKIINQEQTGAVDTIVREIVGARASRSPLFERGMSTRAARKRARTDAGSAGAATGLDSPDKFPQFEERELAARIEKSEARVAALKAARDKAAEESQRLYEAVRRLSKADAEIADDETGPKLPGNDNLDESQIKEIEDFTSKRKTEARKPVGLSPRGEEFEKRIAELAAATVPDTEIDEQGNEREIYVKNEKGKIVKDKRGEPVVQQRPMRDDEIVLAIEDEFDASAEEIAAGLASARQRTQRAMNATQATALAKTLVQFAKNKMYQISGSGPSKEESETLQDTVERVIRAEGIGTSKDDLALLEKYGIGEDTINVASGDPAVLEKIGFSKDRKTPAQRPGAKTNDEVTRANALQQLLLDAEVEAKETGQDIDTVLNLRLAQAEERQKALDEQVSTNSAELRELKGLRDGSQGSGGTGEYFRQIGLGQRFIGDNPFSDLIARGKGRSPEEQEVIDRRAKEIAARYPSGMEGMHGDTLTLSPQWTAQTGESLRGSRGAEQPEGTSTMREIAENPLISLFKSRSVAQNTAQESGVQFSMQTISPAQAGPAIAFSEELFSGIKIIMAELAETLSKGKNLRQSDVADLGVNLALLANLYEQVQTMDPGESKKTKEVIEKLKKDFEALAQTPEIAQLYQPGFVTQTLGKSGNLSEEGKQSTALKLVDIARAIGSGGDQVTGGLRRYGEVQTKTPAAAFGGTPPGGPVESDSDLADRLQQLAAKIQIAEGPDRETLKKQLVDLISNQMAAGNILPSELLELIKDPSLQAEIRGQFSREVGAFKLDTVEVQEKGKTVEKTVGYTLNEKGKRFTEGKREVIDPATQEERTSLVARIVSIEEVVAKLAEDLNAIFPQGVFDAEAAAKADRDEINAIRIEKLAAAEAKLRAISDRVALSRMLSGREPIRPGEAAATSDLASGEIQQEAEKASTAIDPVQQRTFSRFMTRPESASQEEILSGFKSVKSTEDLEGMPEGAISTLAFSTIPPALLERLIQENPGLLELATEYNPINRLGEDGYGPKGGILRVSKEAADALLVALRKAGVGVSMGNFANRENPDAKTNVAVLHNSEELSQDAFAAYMATGVVENIQHSNISGNAGLTVSTPDFPGDRGRKGKVSLAGGMHSGIGYTPQGSIRAIQFNRRNPINGEYTLNRPYQRDTSAHESTHAFTVPVGGRAKDAAEAFLQVRAERLGVEEDQVRSVSEYGTTGIFEAIADANTALQGYGSEAGAQELSEGAPWADSLIAALSELIETARGLTEKANMAGAERARKLEGGALMEVLPQQVGNFAPPSGGGRRSARNLATRSTTDALYSDTTKNYGASFAFATDEAGGLSVTQNTPTPGFTVGGLGKRDFNLLPSDMVPEEITEGMGEEEIKEIEGRNKIKRERFRTAVLQLMEENSEFIKQAIAEGRQIYFGTYFSEKLGKIALDVSELIPYDPKDSKSEASARAKAVADATARNQESAARIEPMPGQGRGTGAGFGLNFDNPDAFPSTGLPENAMAGYRAWEGKRWSAENLPDPEREQIRPAQAAAPSDGGSGMDEMQSRLEETLRNAPEEQLAQDNLRMLLEAKGLSADAIAARIEEVRRGTVSTQQATEAEARKSDALEEVATNAEEDASMFEDFSDEERNEDYYEDDEGGSYEVLPEEVKNETEAQDDAADRIIAAKEKETQAVEDAATASESRAEEVSQALETTGDPSGGQATETMIFDSDTEAKMQKIAELIAARDKLIADRDKLISEQADAIESALGVLSAEDTLKQEDQVRKILSEADRYMAEKEAEFRLTEKGAKVSARTGDYVNQFLPEIYNSETKEYEQMLKAGMVPDQASNTFDQRQKFIFDRLSQLEDVRRNQAETFGLGQIKGSSGRTLSSEFTPASDFELAKDIEAGQSPDSAPPAEAEVNQAANTLLDVRASIKSFGDEIDAVSRQIRNIQEEIAPGSTLPKGPSMATSDQERAASAANARNLDPEATARAQEQILPFTARLSELLGKAIEEARANLTAKGVSGVENLSPEELEKALAGSSIGRKLDYLLQVQRQVSATGITNAGEVKAGVLGNAEPEYPMAARKGKVSSYDKNAADLTGLSINDVRYLAQLIPTIAAQLSALENAARGTSGEVAQLGDASSKTTGNLLESGGQGGQGGGGGGTTAGGGFTPPDPDNDWRNIRAKIPDTENIPRGLKDLAALQNRFNDLAPAILHVGDANKGFSKSLDESNKKAQQASAALAQLTNTNVGVLRAVRTQVGRAATFLVLQQLGREIGGVINHLQSGVFGFNQVLENTQVGFNTLFANTLQANAAVGNELVPKLNEAGVQIGFMREQSVKFADAIDFTKNAAAGMVSQIRDIANVTPFRFQPLVEASLKMKAFGFEAAEIPGMINSISNAVAALGGQDDKIDRIAYALGQMNSAGRVYQNDMMQLANAGIAGYRMLSEKLLMDLTAIKKRSMGLLQDLPEETIAEFKRLEAFINTGSFKKSFGSIDQMMEVLQDPKRAEGLIRNLAKRGFLIGSTAARAITDGMDKQYQGSADRLSRTMTGALSTIADLSQNFMATAFQPLFNSVRDTIVEVGQFMLKSKEIILFVEQVRARMQDFITSLASFGPSLQAAGQVFVDVFVSGLGSALDKSTAFGNVITGVISNLGPGLRLIGDILTNDVGQGLVVATLAFSLFSKAVTANPMIASVTLLVAAISGIAAAIKENSILTAFVGEFVKRFIPSIEQFFKVIGDAVGTIAKDLSSGGLSGFVLGLSVAIDVLMPLLTIFLASMSVLLKIITPFAKPLGVLIGLFLALKTAMMAYDMAGSIVGKVMNGIGGAWSKVNDSIDTQISKVKQTAAAYEELGAAKRAAEDFKRNERGEMLDEKGQVTKDKSKAALLWGEGERVNSYGMTEGKGRRAQMALQGRGFIPGLLDIERGKQQTMDLAQNAMGVRPEFGSGFHLSHPDNVIPHTEPVISNKSIEENYGYLAGAESRLTAFNLATKGRPLTPEEESKKKDLEETARLRQESSKLGMFRFGGLDAGVSVTGDADINKNAGAYSMDNMMSAINMQKQISFVINTAYANLEQAGKDIKKLADEITYLENELKKTTPGTEEHDKLTATLAAKRAENEASIAKIKGSGKVQDATAIIGGMIEADGGDATDLVGQFATGRPIKIPKGSAEAIRGLPDKVKNILMARVLDKQAKGENFLTKQEIEDITVGALGDARGKSALKGMTLGISKKLAGMLTNLYTSIAGKAPKMFQTIERGGGKSGLREIDSRQGQYFYVDPESGLLGNEAVTDEELEKRKRLKGASRITRMGRAVGIAGVAAGLATGASRLAGQVAPILSAPIIGPLLDALPKEMTNIFRQKAGPFQAMAAGIGTAAGSALGQALIPIPGLGAVLGGMIGGALGELVGNFADRMMAESESMVRKKKALYDEAKFLGFTDEQSKAIVEERFGKADFVQNLMTGDPMADLASSYTVDEEFNPMTDEEYNKKRDDIKRRYRGARSVAVKIEELDKERERRSASSSFDQRQADFMRTAMDPEMLKELYGVDNLFARRDAENFRMKNADLLASIDGKIAQNKALSKEEQALIDAYKKLLVEAESSPLGMFGTITDSRGFSPTMMFDALAYAQPRSEYTQADVDAGVTKKDGSAVQVGERREDGLLEVKDLMFDPVILSMTRAAGFGDKVADALDAFGFDLTKITRDMSNIDVIAMMKETLSVGVRRAERAKELTPRIDVTMTRTQMMEEYGAEFGYNKFDELEAQRAEYAKQVAAFEKMGGERRLGFLQEYADEKIDGGYRTFRNAPAGVDRDQYGGEDTSYSVLQEDQDLLTADERVELEALKAQKSKVEGARYVPLTVKMKYRMSSEGDSPEEQAKGLAAETALKNFRNESGKALEAAANAGLKATKEQLALIDKEKSLRDALFTTKERTLDVGEALAVFEGEGIQISNKELANNRKIQEILIEKQNAIKGVANESEAVITSKVAELQAEGVITEIAAEATILDQKQVELERKKLVLLEMQGKLIAANASKDADQIEAAQQAVRAAQGSIDAQNNSITDSQTKIKNLTAKAAAFFEAAEKANPFKLTKKELQEIQKLIAKDPGSILGGDGGKKDAAALQKNIDLLGKMSSIAQQAYDRLRKSQQRTHDEYIKQLDEQEKRINERYQQRSDQQTEENLQAQLQIAGLQMRSESADPLEAAKSFYDAKQALEQFYIDKQKEAELKVISDEKERYQKEFGASGDAQQAIYEAALKRLQSRFDFAQSVLNGDEKMAGKMNDALKMTMFGTSLAGDSNVLGNMISGSYEDRVTANDDFKAYAASSDGKKFSAIKKKSASRRTAAEKQIFSRYTALQNAALKEKALNAIGAAIRGDITGSQDITMTTEEQQALDEFESQNREAIAAALAAGLTKDNSDILLQLETMREEAKTSESNALVQEFGKITTGLRYNSDTAAFTPTSATSRGFAGGIKGLSYGGKAMSTADMKVFRGTTEESGLQATFMNEAIMSNLQYIDSIGKEHKGAGNILSYITGRISSLGGGATGIAKLNDEQEALYTYLMTLVSAKNTFTTAQKTAILAQRTLEQGLNDFEQTTGVDINIANLAEADVTDKQFTDYFNALGKTFEDNAARDEAIQKMRDVLRDTYGQALLSVDVEQYAKFADSNDRRIGTLSGVVTNLQDVMTQIDNVMSAGAASKMTSLDKLLFGQNFDPNNLSGEGNPISNIVFGKTQIDAVSAAVVATRDAFESSMNSIKAYASELSGPLGAFNQQAETGADALAEAMGQTASSFSLATSKVNEYATALAAATAARAALGVDATLATSLASGTTPTSTAPAAAANNTFNITVSNANGMDAQQLAAELARLIALQAGSSVQ